MKRVIFTIIIVQALLLSDFVLAHNRVVVVPLSSNNSKQLFFPQKTTTQRDAIKPVPGQAIFNTDTYTVQVFVDHKLDQKHTTINAALGKAGQSFTAGLTGNWSKIEIHTDDKNQSGTLKVYEGEGTSGTLLLTQAISLQTSYNQIVFPSPIPIVSGQKYTIITDVTLSYDYGAGYPGGVVYYGTSPWGPGGDLYFKTYLEKKDWVDLN